jgi:hypothetical protein
MMPYWKAMNDTMEVVEQYLSSKDVVVVKETLVLWRAVSSKSC